MRAGWKLDDSSAAPTTRDRVGRCSCRPARRSSRGRRSGCTSPSTIRSVVVLPAPFGPRKPVTEPGSTVKLSRSTARTLPPNTLVRSSTTICAGGAVSTRSCGHPTMITAVMTGGARRPRGVGGWCGRTGREAHGAARCAGLLPRGPDRACRPGQRSADDHRGVRLAGSDERVLLPPLRQPGRFRRTTAAVLGEPAQQPPRRPHPSAAGSAAAPRRARRPRGRPAAHDRGGDAGVELAPARDRGGRRTGRPAPRAPSHRGDRRRWWSARTRVPTRA